MACFEVVRCQIEPLHRSHGRRRCSKILSSALHVEIPHDPPWRRHGGKRTVTIVSRTAIEVLSHRREEDKSPRDYSRLERAYVKQLWPRCGPRTSSCVGGSLGSRRLTVPVQQPAAAERVAARWCRRWEEDKLNVGPSVSPDFERRRLRARCADQ